jgi:hypothetical protein
MRIALTSLVALALALAVCACASTFDGLDDPAVRVKLRDAGLNAAAIAGVSSPRTMIAVSSPDHQVAEQLVSGDIINDHVPVYVIEMTGGPFTANAASLPPGQPAPQGSVLTLTVDAQSFDGLDLGIGDTAPDLTQISPHVVDLLAD